MRAQRDELIEKQKTIFDIQARNAIVREIDAIVTRQYPFALLWNINAARLLYWNKFGTPSTVLGKYGTSSAALSYWWSDPDSAAADVVTRDRRKLCVSGMSAPDDERCA